MDLPLLLSIATGIADELDNLSSRVYSDDFGLAHHRPRRQQHYHRPGGPGFSLIFPQQYQLQHQQPRSEGVVSHVGKDGFQVSMDVHQFKPSELTVKTVGNSVVVEGNHEEREDEHGSISRRFVRRYELPTGYDPNHATSTLSSDGVLTIRVPPPPKDEGANERVVPIQQTGPAHLSVKDNAPIEPEENGTSE